MTGIGFEPVYSCSINEHIVFNIFYQFGKRTHRDHHNSDDDELDGRHDNIDIEVNI